MCVPSAENPVLSKVLSFKPGGSQSIAFHASPTARNSTFLIYKLIGCKTPNYLLTSNL